MNSRPLEPYPPLPSTPTLLAEGPKPGGFWMRALAEILDTLILIPFYALALVGNANGWLPVALLGVAANLVYKPVMEWRFGAALGKMICGLRVVDPAGNRLTLLTAYVRYAPFLAYHIIAGIEKVSSGTTDIRRLVLLFVIVDCLAVLFTDRKRAVHDMLACSYCIHVKGEKRSASQPP